MAVAENKFLKCHPTPMTFNRESSNPENSHRESFPIADDAQRGACFTAQQRKKNLLLTFKKSGPYLIIKLAAGTFHSL